MRKFLAIVPAAALLLSSACADTTGPHDIERADGPLLNVSQSAVCQATGMGVTTAVFVNESVVGAVIDLGAAGCTYAIYFDAAAPANARVRNTTVLQTPGTNVSGAGVFNNGAVVSVSKSTFVTNVTGQFVPVRFENGASGAISDNKLRGTHRVGILLRGAGTSATVRGNTIVGSGPKTSGYAENGLQIDQGATADVVKNTFEGHWWDGLSNWASTAALVLSDGVKVTNNRFVDNEFSIYIWGSGNTVTSNRTSSAVVSASFYAYGVLLYGADNHLAGNRMTAVNGLVGLYIWAGSANNRITGNRFDGFDFPIVDWGDDTMIRGKPTPIVP